MTRETSYPKRMVEQTYTKEHLRCDGGGCGVIEDTEPTKRPEGWYSVQFVRDGRRIALDFHDFACFVGWVEAEENPIDMKPWEESIEQLAERQFAAEANRQEQEREE